jgi:phenylalanine ammonia-lyase
MSERIETINSYVKQVPLEVIKINGSNLSIENIIRVAYAEDKVALNEQVLDKIKNSQQYLQQVIEKKKTIYGVTTNFGGLATSTIEEEKDAADLQENLIWGLTCGVGKKLSISHIRAGMLIRANSLVRGISGIRFELISRLCRFLNAEMTPIVYEHGSIGASGDLVPLSYIAGSLAGFSSLYKVHYRGKEISAIEALNLLSLKPIRLQPKEGLALVNGTSMMTGIAANCIYEMNFLFQLSLYVHAFFIQALQGNDEAFAAFVHEHKPHPGQINVAMTLRSLLENSQFLITSDKREKLDGKLLQDRYSIRCLPQYLGVIADGILTIKQQIEVEANSATDNPLIDAENGKIYHSGNFMGQYISVGMDQLRYYLGLMTKHLDTQIALLVTPEFNNGLPASLVEDKSSSIKFGLKGLQICANSIMPLILHLGHGIAPLFPTHAEQFNQNINSQGFSSAVLAAQSLELTRQYLAITLIFAAQAIDLRCHNLYGNYNSCAYLSPKMVKLYKAIYSITQREVNPIHPFIYDNREQTLDIYIERLKKDLENHHGKIALAIG